MNETHIMHNRMYNLAVLLFFFVCPFCVFANISNNLHKIRTLIDDGHYEKAINLLNSIEIVCLSDTSSQVKMEFNLYKGCSLYFLEDYSNAIPYLKQAEFYMRFAFNSGDCNYLETLYGIASCYKHIGDFDNAEKYYRKAIITDEVQSFACNIMKQVYTDLIDLYRSNGRESLADECNSKLEQYNNQLLGLKTAKGSWQEQVEELFDDLPEYNNTFPQDREKIVETYNSILNVIEANVGRYNDDYILYCSLYEMTMQYRINDTIIAIDLCKRLFDIGRNMSVHKLEIATAYTDFLRMTSRANDIETIEMILPEAVDYYNETTEKNRSEQNLYQIIGIGLCDAGNKELGIKYLEKEWDGKECTATVGLLYLADFYYVTDSEKALSYFKKAEYQSTLWKDTSNETKLFIYRGLMGLNQKLGNYTEALVYAQKATPLLYQQQDLNQFAQHLTNCAVLQGRLNDFRGAQNNFQQIEKLYNQLSSETKVYYLSNKGFICLICNKTEDAVQALLQAQDIAISNFGENSYQLETIYHNLGRAYMMLSNYKQALNWLGKSRDLQLKNNGSVMERTEKYIKECNEL